MGEAHDKAPVKAAVDEVCEAVAHAAAESRVCQ